MTWKTTIVAWLALLFWHAPACAVTLRFAYEVKEVAPYFMGEGEKVAARPGITPEALLLLEKKIPGLKVKLLRMPWKRCIVTLHQGEIDAVVASFNAERTESGVYPMKEGQPDHSLRLSTEAYFLYALRSAPVSWDGKTLSGLPGKVGVPLGYSIAGELARLGASVDESANAQSNLDKLAIGRLGGVAALERVGDVLVAQDRYRDIVKLRPALSSKDYYLMLSHQFVKANPQLAQRIWLALAEIRDHEVDKIARRYGH